MKKETSTSHNIHYGLQHKKRAEVDGGADRSETTLAARSKIFAALSNLRSPDDDLKEPINVEEIQSVFEELLAASFGDEVQFQNELEKYFEQMNKAGR